MSNMNAGMAFSQFQSVQGPVDDRLRHSELEGYQPISRIGEVVINSFVDAYEFAQLPEAVKAGDLDGVVGGNDVEFKPHFHEWATVLPGMICVSRKARNATFRNYVAAETATPVIGCCACLTLDDAKNFYFAGVCRSKTVRPIDDGVGPQVDEFFTLAIGGMVTMLNNSKTPIFPGDMIEWTVRPAIRIIFPSNTTHTRPRPHSSTTRRTPTPTERARPSAPRPTRAASASRWRRRRASA